jgi:hypothetical protein
MPQTPQEFHGFDVYSFHIDEKMNLEIEFHMVPNSLKSKTVTMECEKIEIFKDKDEKPYFAMLDFFLQEKRVKLNYNWNAAGFKSMPQV